ncbi:MAG: hypothetical protein AAF202_10615, partial [Pseudomonadota bacterium]
WDRIQDEIERDRQLHEYLLKNYSRDYFQTKADALALRQADPELFQEIAGDLSFTMPVFATEQEANDALEAQSNQTQIQTELGTLGGVLIPTISERQALGLAERPGDAAERPGPIRVLNARWNLLSLERRAKGFRLIHLNKKKKTEILIDQTIMPELGFVDKGRRNLLDELGGERPEVFQRVHMNIESERRDQVLDRRERERAREKARRKGEVFDESEDKPAQFAGLEIRLDGVMTNAMDFLEHFYEVNRFSNRLYYLQSPLQRGRMLDGDNHIHASFPNIEGERETDLTVIARSWNHLTVLTELSIGNQAWHNPERVEGAFFVNIWTKGYVRAREKRNGTVDYVEIRNSIFPPEQTLEQLMYLYQLSDTEVQDYVYGQMVPKLSNDRIMDIAMLRPDLYRELVDTPAFVKHFPYIASEYIQARLLNYFEDRLLGGEETLFYWRALSSEKKTAVYDFVTDEHFRHMAGILDRIS